MEARYLLDTNICIYIRSKKPQRVFQFFDSLIPGEAAISVITYGELLYGAHKSSQREAALRNLREFIQLVPALPLPESAADAYGSLRAELSRKGEVISANDLWIAAHALVLELTLVTNNEKEFRRVRGLKIQNWVT